MAATEATRRNRTILRTSRVTDRRGDHAAAPVKAGTKAPEARPVTPAMHITPDVVIAARGAIRGPRSERRSTSLRSLRRFAA